MKMKKFIKKYINLYNIAILACIIIIIVSICIIVIPKNKRDVVKVDGVEIIQSNKTNITEEDAKNIAVKQLKKLKDKTKKDELNVKKIRRGQVEYYYVTTADNNMEIEIATGKITRINTVLVGQ